MTDSIKPLVDAIVTGDNVKATTIANNLIHQRTMAQVDNVKLDMAKNPWPNVQQKE